MSGICRVLKPGGYFVITEYYRPSLRAVVLLGPYAWTFPRNTCWTELLEKYDFKHVTREKAGPIGIFVGQKIQVK
jgi:SAM-dependent methyltransferase